MPGLITHYIGGQTVLKAVSPEIQEIITPQIQIFNLGTQGPDIFFYYVTGLLKKRTRGIGHLMHKENLGLVFMHMADCLKKAASKEERQIIFAYTAGFIVHYALDANTHPFVYAHSSTDGRKLKTSVDHRKLETVIDVIMLKLTSGKRPSAYELWRLIKPGSSEMTTASQILSRAITETYKRKIAPKDVYLAMRHMIRWTRFLQSSSGRKKQWMELVEDLTIRAHALSSLIHMQTAPDVCDYMNIGKASWRPPWDQQTARNDSFVELYESAMLDAAQMLEGLYAYVEDNITRNQLVQIIGNRSLKTGINQEAV